MGRRLALLIATYRYQDSGLGQLTSPAHDTEALAAVLRDPDIAGFEVTTLVNEPHHRVGAAIGEFYRGCRGDDLALLYFTGHGLKDDNGRLYLAMTDTRLDSLLFTAPSAEQIDAVLEDCASRQKVLILDCCYSGAYPGGRFTKADRQVHTLERFQGRGRTVLTVSDATSYSFEGGQPHGEAARSVFTRHLVAGLRDGTADLNGDGDITLDELYTYVHDRVVEEMPQQRPKKQENIEGRTVIARNVNWTIPAHLEHALASPNAADRQSALDTLAHLRRTGNPAVRDRVTERLRALAEDDTGELPTAETERPRSLLDPPAAARPTRGSRRGIIALAATVLVTLGAGVVFAARTPEPSDAYAISDLAISPNGDHLYVTADFAVGHVWAIDTKTNRRARTPVTVGTAPAGLAVSPPGYTVYVANRLGNSVSVIDLLNKKVNPPIGVSSPQDVAVTPSGAYAFVTSELTSSVAVIDTKAGKVKTTIKLGAKPAGLAVDDEHGYVAAGGGVTVIDTATFKVVGEPIPTGGGARNLVISGRRVYVANETAGSVSVIDTATNKVVKEVSLAR